MEAEHMHNKKHRKMDRSRNGEKMDRIRAI